MWSFGSLIGVLIAGVILGFIGNLLASWFGVRHTSGIDWWRHVFQVIAAVIAVLAADALYPKVRSNA